MAKGHWGRPWEGADAVREWTTPEPGNQPWQMDI
jgi:hypothetical protein